MARFTRTLGTMIASGVPILDGLDIVAKTAGNMVIEEALYDVKAAISEGKTIAEPLAESEVFPGMVVQMIAVGEETGAMETHAREDRRLLRRRGRRRGRGAHRDARADR